MSEAGEGDKARLGPEFADALVYAFGLHAKQVRKGTSIPYVSHLLAVASLVIEGGGDEDEAIAALLHDAAEDQGGEARLAEIERRFGPRVAAIVRECSDTTAEVKEAWEVRRARYRRRVETEMSSSGLRVSLADKLHNATAIVRDHRMHGDAVWSRFRRDKETTARTYRALVDAYSVGLERVELELPQLKELDRVVDEMEAAAAR